MAQSNAVMNEKDLLRCSLCRNRFKHPRLLPCAHSFCQDCLIAYKNTLTDQPFTCPICNRMLDVPQNGVKGFPLNVCFVNLAERLDFFEQLTAKAGKAQKCNFCQQDDIVAFCLECSIAICTTCQKGHSRLPGMKVHSVIRIEKVTDAKYMAKIAIIKAPYCSKHEREKFRYYCRVCEKLVCRDCTILDHRDHECVEAKGQAPETREKLNSLLDQGDLQMKEYISHIETGTKGMQNIKKKAQEECQHVKNVFEDLIRTLQENKNALCSQILSIRDQKIANIQSGINEATTWVESMRNAQGLTRKIAEVNNPWEILALTGSMEEAFDSLHDQAERRNNWGYNELDLSASFSPAYTPEELLNTKVGDLVEESIVLLNYDPMKNEVVRQYVPK